MWSTPAPEFTASVAGMIWSGVGEVKTAPGTAASSIPRPTKPACSGSWPLPPPETRPTLPATGASRRVTYLGSELTVTRSAWASPKPSTDSSTTARGSLMSFFTAGLLGSRCFSLTSVWMCFDPTTGTGPAVVPAVDGPEKHLESFDHPRVAQRVWLYPGKVQELRHAFVVGAQQFRIHLRVKC